MTVAVGSNHTSPGAGRRFAASRSGAPPATPADVARSRRSSGRGRRSLRRGGRVFATCALRRARPGSDVGGDGAACEPHSERRDTASPAAEAGADRRRRDPHAGRNRAAARSRRGRRAAAARCLELAPAFDAARHNYAVVLHRLNKPHEALAELDTLLRDDPPNPAYRNLKAAVLCRIGEYEPAIAIYAALLGEQPAQPHVWLSYGHALKTAGHSDRAIAAYRRCIALDAGLRRGVLEPRQPQDVPLRRRRDRARCARRSRATILPRNTGCTSSSRSARRWRIAGDYASVVRALRARQRAAPARRCRTARTTPARVLRARASCSRPSSSARAKAWARDAPDPIFIVGLPRSGSTLIEQILASHSAVEGTMELPEIISITRALRARARAALRGAYPEALARMDARRAARARRAVPRAHAHPAQARPAVLHRQDAEQLPARRPDPARSCRTRRSSMRAGIRWLAASPASSSISRAARTSATTSTTSAATTATTSG